MRHVHRRERRRAIAKDVEGGLSHREAARRYGLSIETVKVACREYGVTVKTQGRAFEILAAWVRRGPRQTYAKVAKELGVTRERVCEVATEAKRVGLLNDDGRLKA